MSGFSKVFNKGEIKFFSLRFNNLNMTLSFFIKLYVFPVRLRKVESPILKF